MYIYICRWIGINRERQRDLHIERERFADRERERWVDRERCSYIIYIYISINILIER